MTKAEQITALDANYMLARHGWRDKSKFIFMAKHLIPSKVMARIGLCQDRYDVLLMHECGTIKPYHYGNDLIANDWYIIETD